MSIKPNCREVHQLASEAMDRELSLVERARMHMHLLVCAACRNFSGQMQLLRRAMRDLVPSDNDNERPPR
ncbi:zf-HC2 domain-containing protein [Noviherbaspirillum saxi]|uniref:Zf-HC2 domain-containing protein n=1 Tax=Noviherbaspirillum saxi TaxID=2320863 RepID=A0A3A3FNS3_9BURK|nr:zf-HC2 domain-containing protein [Noviherbaspirillum saxi]RJF97543.1 zf-HC2 domain-containing protein [Noviherbaspirillum saxi]